MGREEPDAVPKDKCMDRFFVQKKKQKKKERRAEAWT